MSKIRSYKLARAFDNILLAYIADGTLAMAECLAFNQTDRLRGRQIRCAPDMTRYIKFYRDNREYFNRSREVAGGGGAAVVSVHYLQPRARATWKRCWRSRR